MRIDLVSREDPMARYVVYADDGAELKQVSRDVSEEIAEARKRRKPLLDVLAERENITRPRRQNESLTAVGPVVLSPDEHTHAEFGDFLRGMPDHEHGLEQHNHPHSHDDLTALRTHFNTHEQGQHDDLVEIQKQLGTHSHGEKADIVHEHVGLTQRVENAETLLTGLRDRPVQQHDHPHNHDEFEGYEGQIKAIWTAISEIRRALEGHTHVWPVHAHEPVKHEHAEYSDALDAHVTATGLKTNARILSREEVAGKTRLIVEEL